MILRLISYSKLDIFLLILESKFANKFLIVFELIDFKAWIKVE